MLNAGLLIETFYPQTLTETADGMGGVTKTWADGTAFRGRLSAISYAPDYEKMSEDRITVFASHKLFCNYQSLNEKQRIRNADSTRFFNIKAIVNPSNMNHHLELILQEIK